MISAISSGVHLLHSGGKNKPTSPVHLSQIANVHVESGLKQRDQGQIYSTAVIRKLSTVFLVLTARDLT